MEQPPVDGRRARWAGHREQRRGQFVDAAIAVIDRVGPGATVDQIGAELGVTRQAVYRQFTDRRDLDAAVARRAADLLVAALLPHLEDGLHLDRLDATVAGILDSYLDFVQQHLSLYRFVRSHEADLAGERAVRQVKDSLASRIADLAAGVLAELDLPAALAQTFATGMIGMADAVIGRWLDEPRGLDRQQLVDQLTVLTVGAVQASLARTAPPVRRR